MTGFLTVPRRLSWVVVFLILGSWGCSDDAGPREYEVAFVRDGGAVGAVTVQVSGGEITTFEPVGSTLVFSAPIAGSANQWRVVLLHEGPGDPKFLIVVEDSRGARPTVSVVEAVDQANEEIQLVSSVTARFGS